MKTAIVSRARELGFDDWRITTAEAPESVPAFQRWLAEGFQGEMGYLQKNAHKRADPQQVLAGVRSVVTLVVNYARRQPAAKPDPTRTGLIARYARGPDYHDLLAAPLRQLASFINDLGGPGTRSLWYVDTGPILERDLAQRAGLGFVGKHTNLISRRFGNWFLLAEIFTTLELPPDLPEKNRCGSCSRCIPACPTGAIVAPFQLDARRCISYLTIELKGPIPVELRPLVGNRIFGCDDCLAACPWNRFARESNGLLLEHRDDLATPDLLRLLELSEHEFKNCFGGTPMMRTKRRGLLRNVCVALGNVGNSTALPALETAAGDREPLIAEHAAWAIQEIKRRSGNS